MRYARSSCCPRTCLLWLVCLAFCRCLQARAQTQRVLQIQLHDTLQGESASIFSREIARANTEHYDAILVNLSTPGGLPDAADEMVTAMRQSRVPVIVWAGKPHTRIAGQGLRLLEEADIALLNPEALLTPLWSQRPHGLTPHSRSCGGQHLLATLYAASLAHARNSALNGDLASGTHWISADEALRSGLIDGTAEKVADALRLASSRTVPRFPHALQLNGAHVETATIKPQEELLLTLMNPDLCILLLTLGLLLVYLEINTPGTVIPGAAGVLLVLLAAYALLILPLSTGGILLCIAAALLLLVEARFPAHGIVASFGILALIFGLGTLVRGPLPQLQVSWPTAIGAGTGFGGVTAALIVLGMEARRAKVKTGADAMLGWLAVAQTALAPEGKILVRGELWHARLTSRDSSVAAGERVKVLRADGTTLEVTAVHVTTVV